MRKMQINKERTFFGILWMRDAIKMHQGKSIKLS